MGKYKTGDNVVIVLDGKIKIGKIYDYNNELDEYRVSDGELEKHNFTFSTWVEEEYIAPLSQLPNIKL
jgi:hypothetical protein